MAAILFAWQLGAGLGHMMQMLPLAQGLVERGHRVFLALRNLSAAPAVFGRLGVHFLQAPFKSDGRAPFARTPNFAHILANTGFGSDAELQALAFAWRNLYRLIRPAVIIFDHSPIALLAARGLPVRRVLLGTGFFCPPDTPTLPNLQPLETSKAASPPIEIQKSKIENGLELQLLDRINRLLAHWKQPPLPYLAKLWAEVEENFLTTFPELDHYGAQARGLATPAALAPPYWGPITASGGAPPQWPGHASEPSQIEDKKSKTLFAYLKPFPMLPALLTALRRRGWPTLIYPDGLDRRLVARFAGPTIRFQSERPDPAAAAAGCAAAILNANHGTVCDFLRAGKPILSIPLQTEQRLLAAAIERTGAGVTLLPAGPGGRRGGPSADVPATDRRRDHERWAQAIEHALDTLVAGPPGRAAADFAARHAAFDPAAQRQAMLARLERLAE
jgi:hypothetical protein